MYIREPATSLILPCDVLDGLRALDTASVQTVVTSPPYFGLRDYKLTPTTWGDGWRGCLGLEPTPDLFVTHLVEVFREVRRVLRDDGTVWLNLGDSFARSAAKGGSGTPNGRNGYGEGYTDAQRLKREAQGSSDGRVGRADRAPVRNCCEGVKPKDLLMMPARVALALQADGWYLRMDIVWAKGLSFCPTYAGSVMPESVTDRPTKTHEYIFLLTKGQWKSRVIQFTDFPRERFHLGQHTRLQPTNSWASDVSIVLASSIFDQAQTQHDFSLPPFYAKEWQQSTHSDDSFLIRGMPSNHRLTAICARFLCGETTTEVLMQQIQGFWRNLRDGDQLLKSGRLPVAASPQITSDGNGTVTINNPGEICKFDFVHGSVSIARPGGSSYWYDAEGVKEKGTFPAGTRAAKGSGAREGNRRPPTTAIYDGKRHLRSVWAIGTKPFKEAHFATFPEALVVPCMTAGTPPSSCSRCGAPYTHDVIKSDVPPEIKAQFEAARICSADRTGREDGHTARKPNHVREVILDIYEPGCTCGAPPAPALVLDPFAGAGTVGVVAKRMGRSFLGLELNPEYVALAEKRIDAAPGPDEEEA